MRGWGGWVNSYSLESALFFFTHPPTLSSLSPIQVLATNHLPAPWGEPLCGCLHRGGNSRDRMVRLSPTHPPTHPPPGEEESLCGCLHCGGNSMDHLVRLSLTHPPIHHTAPHSNHLLLLHPPTHPPTHPPHDRMLTNGLGFLLCRYLLLPRLLSDTFLSYSFDYAPHRPHEVTR